MTSLTQQNDIIDNPLRADAPLPVLQVWLPAVKAKGLEISGTFSRRQGHMYMDMTFTNKALQHMTDFAVQFNKNR